ncbi:MAG: hypothetical protein U5L03_11830 [Burkholderiaceae bacterium]|nr:hypothetical protein [Burkholderiaceae bacterium]
MARAISSRRPLTGSSSGNVIDGSGLEGGAARGEAEDDMESGRDKRAGRFNAPVARAAQATAG